MVDLPGAADRKRVMPDPPPISKTMLSASHMLQTWPGFQSNRSGSVLLIPDTFGVAWILFPSHGSAALRAFAVVAGLADDVRDRVATIRADTISSRTCSSRPAHPPPTTPATAATAAAAPSSSTKTHDTYSFPAPPVC